MDDDDPGAAGPPRSHAARPIVVYLLALAFLALVPGFLFSAVLIQRNSEAQDAVVQTLTQATTRALLQSVDHEITGMVSTLRALAASPAVGEQDLRLVYARAQGALSGTRSYLVLINENFEQLINTRFPYGADLPPVQNRANISEVLATGRELISGVIYSATSERHVVPVLVPHRADDGTGLVVALTQDASAFAPVLMSQKLPDGWQVALLDADHLVIALGDGNAEAVGQPFFIPRADVPLGERRWIDEVVDGVKLATITRTSPLTGWQVVAWAPRELIDRPRSEAIWSLAIGGILLVALVAAAIFWVTRRIALSVRGLAADARRLGSGQPSVDRRYPILEIATVANAIAEAHRQRLSSEAEVRFLVRELAHRSKNQMTVIAAMAKQTAKGADTVPDFVQSFEKRIFGLARSTDLLLANGALGVDLEELLVGQIDPFCPLASGRVILLGPATRLSNQSAQILGMAAHELATNAVKYGAFSRDDGTLAVRWERRDGRLDVTWREHVTNLGTPSGRRGFGTVVLENMVGSALGAEVTRRMHDDGIEWTFSIPAESVDPAALPGEAPGAGEAPAA